MDFDANGCSISGQKCWEKSNWSALCLIDNGPSSLWQGVRELEREIAVLGSEVEVAPDIGEPIKQLACSKPQQSRAFAANAVKPIA